MELSKARGIVLLSAPIGEKDRRVVLLTKERGKMSAFARSAMNPKNPLCAATMPFAFGDFYFYEGRNSNTVTQAEIINYFPELHEDLESAYYGLYFLELADYYTQEYNDETEVLKLLYQSLRALSHEEFAPRLVRVVYEWKMLVLNGEYPDVSGEDLSSTARYTLQFIAASPVGKLYSFRLSEQVLSELEGYMRVLMRRTIDRELKTSDMLKMFDNE